MTEFDFKTPQSMFHIVTKRFFEAVDVVVDWKICLDIRDSHIENRVIVIDKIEGKIKHYHDESEEEFDELDVAKFEIVNDMPKCAIGIREIVFDLEDEIAYVE